MELSIRDAKARFSEALEAAARGERVVVTKRGKPFAEIVAAQPSRGFDFERAARLRKERGWENAKANLPDYFDDPEYSRKVLGLDE